MKAAASAGSSRDGGGDTKGGRDGDGNNNGDKTGQKKHPSSTLEKYDGCGGGDCCADCCGDCEGCIIS